MRHVYVVQVLLEVPDRWWDLCRCLSADAAVAVVRSLLLAGDLTGQQLKVVVREEVTVG